MSTGAKMKKMDEESKRDKETKRRRNEALVGIECSLRPERTVLVRADNDHCIYEDWTMKKVDGIWCFFLLIIR